MNNYRFKFRVWDIENKEYIYFDLFSIKTEITYHKLGIIKKNIIEQSTGLKDKNGKLIYEGDIVKIDSRKIGGEIIQGEIIFNQDITISNLEFGIFTRKGYHKTDFLGNITLIGNIHTFKRS